jgi:hypothetical protein
MVERTMLCVCVYTVHGGELMSCQHAVRGTYTTGVDVSLLSLSLCVCL